jgi:hypothetical protein
MEGLERKAALKRARELASRSWRTVITVSLLQFVIPLVISALIGRLSVRTGTTPGNTKVSMQAVSKQLSGLINIVVVPLMSIVPALLYLKMRQMGGETLSNALTEIEKVDTKHRLWQQRMRSRLSLPTPRGRSSLKT